MLKSGFIFLFLCFLYLQSSLAADEVVNICKPSSDFKGDDVVKNIIESCEKISKKIEKTKENPDTYVSELKKILNGNHKTSKLLKKSRSLVQFPLLGKKGNIGPCGSHHYLPDTPIGVDAYASPVTACVFASVLQDWKKNHCLNKSGCTIQWGDISNAKDKYFNTHKSHTDGYCLDIRPLRKGGFDDSGMNMNSKKYDKAKTTELVRFLKAKGGEPTLFNDPATGAKKWEGHEDHIHVCFKDTNENRNRCAKYQVDENICSEKLL